MNKINQKYNICIIFLNPFVTFKYLQKYWLIKKILFIKLTVCRYLIAID